MPELLAVIEVVLMIVITTTMTQLMQIAEIVVETAVVNK